MRRIRVLQLIAGLAIGDQSGGAEYFGIRLARLLNKDIFDSAVFAMWRFSSPTELDWQDRLRGEGISVSGLVTPTGSLPRDLLAVFRELQSVVSDFKPDVINSHSERGEIFNILTHWLHPVHPLSVRSVQGEKQWETRPLLGMIINQAIFPLAFAKEIAVSDTVRQLLDKRALSRLLNKKSMLCYNGIDTDLYVHSDSLTENFALPVGIPNTQPRLGIVGRLTDQKGIAVLIQAMKIVCQYNKNAQLVIVGSGPLETSLRQQSYQIGLRDNIHFLGSRNDLIDILSHLDILVSSSNWEGLPTILLEAMALEVPVIATDVSGSRELIKTGFTGILVPPNNPGLLADAIINMLQTPDQAHLMAKTAKELVKHYTIQVAVQQYAQIYKQLCKRQ
jgi:glycosyltransferase involved in cell wall biosynthesis